jgi:hypothetical protein
MALYKINLRISKYHSVYASTFSDSACLTYTCLSSVSVADDSVDVFTYLLLSRFE